jgi:tRNA A37 N6-isopentenylltransferase MiaA
VPPSQPSLNNGKAPVAISVATQELIMQRVLQRIDLVLESRLHDAIKQLIQEHTQAMMPRLREEIELVVRESVAQAFEQESSPSTDLVKAP